MYAASTFTVGAAAGHGWMTDFAQAWVWVAYAVWLLIALGTIVRGASLLAGRAGAPAAKQPAPA